MRPQRTPEEEAEFKKHMEGLGEAIKRIRATKQNQGTIECPICQKKLGFSVAKSNGHIWGRCETAGCLAWMQ